MNRPASVPAPVGGPRLKARHLSCGYGSRLVMRSLDLDVLDGELTVILGPNACGKSTFLKALARVVEPQAGLVTLDGRPLKSFRSKTLARELAMLPQTPEAPLGVTVADVVARGRYPHQTLMNSWTTRDDAACERAMTATNVWELRDRPVESLSGGQRQRAWIAMTLAQSTPVILLDEPTTYLDITHQIEVLDVTRRLHEEGRTVVVVLHDLNLALRYATHLVLMKEGAIIAQGPPSQLVTSSLVERVFDLPNVVIEDPATGGPLVVPLDTRGARAGREHPKE